MAFYGRLSETAKDEIVGKRRRKDRLKKSTDREVAGLLSDRDERWLFPGEFWNWKMSTLPGSYLRWVIENLTEREFLDKAEVERFRRKHK